MYLGQRAIISMVQCLRLCKSPQCFDKGSEAERWVDPNAIVALAIAETRAHLVS
jgi:hypothetical protein